MESTDSVEEWVVITEEEASGRWSVEEAKAWANMNGWRAGCNFMPAYAGNQLEMFQEATFDIDAIKKELGWAGSLGFKVVRVFLHNLLWDDDSKGFLCRIDQVLGAAAAMDIKVILVLFDSCWNPIPKLGKQPAPTPYVHNSVWVQAPGKAILSSPAKQESLQPYVEGVVSTFKDDSRVYAWDLYNEPDNPNDPAYCDIDLNPKAKSKFAQMLVAAAFKWARKIRPSQPLTSGTWQDFGDEGPMNQLQNGLSDIISFHCYSTYDATLQRVRDLKERNEDRPLVCTEYMARPVGSTFDPILEMFKHEGVSCTNWGFVAGKTQTYMPWDSWTHRYTAEPVLWFHDILREDGTPYHETEVQYIRSICTSGR